MKRSDIDEDALYIVIGNYFGKNNRIYDRECPNLDCCDPDANYDIDEDEFMNQFLDILELYNEELTRRWEE